MVREYDGGEYDEKDTDKLNARWERLVKRELNTKKGQRFLMMLENVLVEMTDKRLAEGGIVEYKRSFNSKHYDAIVRPTGLTCVLGEAFITKLDNNTNHEFARQTLLLTVASELEDGELEDYRSDGFGGLMGSADMAVNEFGAPYAVAWSVVEVNDENPFETPEERYQRVLKWLRENIKPEVLA